MAKSTWVPHVVSLAISYDCEERGANGGTPDSITSTSNSNSGFTNIDLTQEMLDKVRRQKILLKEHKLD